MLCLIHYTKSWVKLPNSTNWLIWNISQTQDVEDWILLTGYPLYKMSHVLPALPENLLMITQ